jgi:long-chain acyl-CoA synthetase
VKSASATRDTLLWDQWRQTVRERRKDTALIDIASGQRWSFGHLDEEAEKPSTTGPVAFPQGPRFIPELLRAWRAGQVVCPLEPGQEPPSLGPLPGQCVHVKLTSATTGAARMIVFTGEQLAADADNVVATMGLRPDAPNVAAISLAHSYGFSNLVLPLLLHGISLILAEGALPEAVRRAAQAADKITLPGVPALWRVWHEADAIPGNVRLGISAGAPLALALEQSVFGRHGLKIHNFYGSSECGGIAYDASPAPRCNEALAGAPMENVRLAVGPDGCLEVRSAAVGETYWPEASDRLAGGCFCTSDLAELREGLVYLRGRAGERINVAGRKVSPEEIERALGSHPQVRECLVFGVPSADGERGEIIAACVVAAGELSDGQLKEFLSQRLPGWQVPREWRFVDSLETGERGKPSRSFWRTKFLGGRE